MSVELEFVPAAYKDLNKPDIIVLRSGLEGANTVKRYYPRAQDTLIKDDAQCFQAVQDGTAHVFHCIAGKAVLICSTEKTDGSKRVGTIGTRRRPGSTEWRAIPMC